MSETAYWTLVVVVAVLLGLALGVGGMREE